MEKFEDFNGDKSTLKQRPTGVGIGEQAYLDLHRMARQAYEAGDKVKRDAILRSLAQCDRRADMAYQDVYEKYGKTVEPSTWALAQSRVRAEPEVAAIPDLPPDIEPGQFDWMAAYRRLQRIRNYYMEQKLFPAHADFHRALLRIGDSARHWFKVAEATLESVPVREHGLLRAAERQYLAIENKARLAAESNDDEQVERVERSRMGLHHATMKVLDKLAARYGTLEDLVERIEQSEQSGPVTAPPPAGGRQPPVESLRPPARAAGSGSVAPGTPPRARPRDDDYAVERALIAGNLPPGFDASLLIAEARTAGERWLVDDLEARRLPTRTIDGMLERYEAAGTWGSYAPVMEHLRSVRDDIERALRVAYPRRTEPEWLDRVQARLLRRAELPQAGQQPAP